LPALIVLFVTLIAATALAGGRIDWKSKTFKERSDKSWMLELAIYLPRSPDVAYVPMKFEFQPEVYYERSLVDGHDGPVDRKVPLENRQPLIESVDVGFMDQATTKIESRTRFSFKVKRDLGYEAGEYKVTVRDTRNGQVVGSPTTIIFDGENEIIDRRAMVFSGEKKKKPEEKKPAASDDDKKKESADSDSDKPASDGDKDDSAEGNNSGGDKPAPVEKKSSGCGCRVSGTPANGFEWALPLALGVAFAARRRKHAA
jgi:MYXO-CTERM domain-containing protein